MLSSEKLKCLEHYNILRVPDGHRQRMVRQNRLAHFPEILDIVVDFLFREAIDLLEPGIPQYTGKLNEHFAADQGSMLGDDRFEYPAREPRRAFVGSCQDIGIEEYSQRTGR